jgi:hypothetical protein
MLRAKVMSPDNIVPFPTETPRKRVPIDFIDLELAMDDWHLNHFSYLDTETGEVIFISEFDPDEEMEELKEVIEADESGRYRDIPRADSGEDYRDMLDWAAALDDGALHDELWDALERNHPFRRFRESSKIIRPSRRSGICSSVFASFNAPSSGLSPRGLRRRRC